jgi:hypothetical protein
VRVRDLDRREFLRAGGMLVAAISLAGPLPPVHAAGGGAVLCARRRATYRALLGALHHAPDGRFRHCDPARGARAFADWYAAQEPAVRLHADAVLDAVERLLAAAGAGAPRYAALRDRPLGAAPDAAEAANRATIVAALALAARTCEPESDDDDRPVAPELAR